ncbi:MAG: DNA repair protein RecO [bacterium]|nr:DNA repair protein RecO [bacterium]
MRNLSAPALILDLFDLGEKDRLVSFLTAEWGKKRGVARGARAKYSRFAGQLQPLARVEVRWFEKEGRELVRISEVDLLRPAMALQEDLEGILMGSYLAEHMMEFAQENEASERLFRLLDTTIEALLAGADRQLAARYFEIWVLRLSGIFPVPRQCPLCGRPLAGKALLDQGEAALVCPGCAASESVPGAGRFAIGEPVLDFLRRSGSENLDQIARRLPDAGVLERVEELCARVRRHFLQHELKSYRVMRQTLASL